MSRRKEQVRTPWVDRSAPIAFVQRLPRSRGAAIGFTVGLALLVDVPLALHAIRTCAWWGLLRFVLAQAGMIAGCVLAAGTLQSVGPRWIAWCELRRQRRIHRALGAFERKLVARIPKDPPVPERDHPYR